MTRGAPPFTDKETHVQQETLSSTIPDLTNLSLEQLAELGTDSVLAHSVVLYRQRLSEEGAPLSAFQAKIA
jgi:hypothetical protein